MIHYPAPPLPTGLVEKMQALVDSGMPQPDVILKMREAGISIGRSIFMIQDFYNLPHPQAKMAVHYSDAWADMRASTDRLHEAAFEALQQAGFEEVPTDSLSTAS